MIIERIADSEFETGVNCAAFTCTCISVNTLPVLGLT